MQERLKSPDGSTCGHIGQPVGARGSTWFLMYLGIVSWYTWYILVYLGIEVAAALRTDEMMLAGPMRRMSTYLKRL